MNSNTQRCGIVTVALMLTLAASKAIDRRPAEMLAQPLASIPMQVNDWSATDDPPIRADILAALDPSSYISRTYRRRSESVNLFVAYYANQKAGESMHSPRHCLPGSGWEFLSYGEADIEWNGRKVRVNHNIIQKDGVRMAVLYWYQSRRRVVADEYRAKLYLIRDAVTEGRTGGAIVRIMCPASPDQVQAALEFATAAMPDLQRTIGVD